MYKKNGFQKLFTEDKKKSNWGKQLDRSAIEKKKKIDDDSNKDVISTKLISTST